ncbi:MAG: DUF87 domain-containing protein [Pseudomonadota bacterium]|nr:DUF87 domain-containing protein [Pseudomonadota bacterium]
MFDSGHTIGHVISVTGSRIQGILNHVAPDHGDGAGAGEHGIVDIELMGEAAIKVNNSIAFVFRRGVSVFPGLGETIMTTTQEEMAEVYARPSNSHGRIGTLYQNENIPAYIMTDDLLGKHFAVLGTTGAGKSCSVVLLLRTILTEHPNGHIVLLDPHNEYSHAFGDTAEILNTENLQLPYWILNFDEIRGVLIDENQTDSEVQAEILGRAIVGAKLKFAGGDPDSTHITIDTLVPYNLNEIVRFMDASRGQLEKPEGSLPYLKLKSRIEALKADRRYAFMFAGLVVKDNLSDVVSRIMRVPVTSKPLTILDLSGVPSEIVDIVVSVMCRIIFDFCLWSTPTHSVPVLLVCEEAHRYVPEADNVGFGPTKRIISQIAKEGRKYGVSLCLVNQRPSELSTSIMSQCNTLFALRMSNETDQEFIRKAVPESALGMMSSLSSLHTHAVGEGLTVPMRLKFDDLDEAHRPRSGTAAFSTVWREDSMPQTMVAEIVQRWRSQSR